MEELTPREMEVLALGFLGNAEQARRLNISTRTLKNHWSSIYRKFFGPASDDERLARVIRTRAMMKAFRMGLIHPDRVETDKRCRVPRYY